jgi:hypothetical protein
MNVVQRCPHCGTTRATPGECEACHEAQVRYYCTNHAPGLWLDGPACPKCGARFGDSVLREAPPAKATASRARATTPPRARPTPTPPPPRPSRAASLPKATGAAEASHRERWPARDLPAPGEREWEPSAPGMALVQQILRAILSGRSGPLTARRSERPRSRSGVGCLLRLLLIGLVLLLTLGGALVLFGWSLLQGF